MLSEVLRHNAAIFILLSIEALLNLEHVFVLLSCNALDLLNHIFAKCILDMFHDLSSDVM